MFKLFLRLLALLLFCGAARATEKVVLQLKWEHEFQFAGYYAAKWQGFYQDAGLDVEIRSAARANGTMANPIEEIKSGNADFAVGGLDILIGKDQGVELVVLASIFQRSPSAVFSLPEVPLNNLSQLAKLRIAVIDSDSTKMEIEALFKARGYDIDTIQFVDEPVTVETLINRKADAIVTYEVSALIQSKEKKITLNKLLPGDFGLSFYGDTLYTSQRLSQNRPDLVEKFISATQQGWLYALNNKQQIAQQISTQLPRYIYQYDNVLDYNLAFSDLIDNLIQYPQKPIGYINQDRWFTMNERIRSLGLVRSHLDKSSFFFSTETKADNYLDKIIFILALVALTPAIFIFWYKRYLLLTITGILAITLIIELELEANLEKDDAQAVKLNLLQQLSSVSAKLEGNLQTNLSMLSGFAAYISATPDLTYDEYANYASEIFKKEPMLINFAAAKDLVVNYVYPLKNNEKAIGLDYRKNDAQREMVMQVANSGQLLVAGPVNLVQGGVAFIGRAPIYTGDGSDRRLWGIISAPLDAESLYQHSDVRTLAKETKLAIKSYDSLGREGPVFFGEKRVFEDPERVQFIISVGGGTWHLAASPIGHNENFSTNILFVRLASLIIVLIICSFTSFRFKQEREKQKLETLIRNNQKLLEKVGSVARIGGWKVDEQLNFAQWSQQSSLLLKKPAQYKPENINEIAELFEKDGLLVWKSNIDLAIKTGSPFDIELELNSKDDQKSWLRIIASSSRENEQTFVTGTLQDVTDKVLSAKLIEHQATYDSLTDLPNRILFNDRLNKAIDSARRNKNKIAVLFIDLDRFKPVNDNHGHQIGDRLLIESAKRIQSCVRESDTVSRLSGDEFGVIIANVPHYNTALKITEIILENMQQAYHFDEIVLHCSASIGIALYPDDGENAQSLLRKADQAMYTVKGSGRNGWQFYTREMQQNSEYRHALLNHLIIAVKNRKLATYYQPILDLKTNRVTKCEALARWQKADGQFIPPVEFISLAEESGLINKIDLLMLENAVQALIKINQKGRNVGLSINVSPRLFHTRDKALETWMECIKTLSQKINITVEITERLLTDDSEKALSVLEKLKTYNVKIAIDDFGTGYSSLSYLVKFPVDIIKIDREFVEKIEKESSAETLIETILVMAKRLKIKVVAEGIETQQQLNFLVNNHCDFGQGYYLGKPMSENNFREFIFSDSLIADKS
ncbi:EAL domain-containing protein [Aliikangiella coralliicola]|uniref:EAL domain-containing protein n=1 Tax=Aliikangiella coralliicola TaxID=2592383 RepID=A0A545UJP5_9GAMM|nr:EAL domain-containing protein [Aliikangiella coralliicola]TQV89695.1 EAL domain-containing protein [Aliikangiella coralliicola]